MSEEKKDREGYAPTHEERFDAMKDRELETQLGIADRATAVAGVERMHQVVRRTDGVEELISKLSPMMLKGLAELEKEHPRTTKILNQCLASDEPFIVFRAKDIFTPMVVSYYIGLLENTFGHDSNLEQQEALVEHRREMVQWQRRNPERVKLPD